MTEYTTLGNLISPAKVIRCGNGSYPVLSMTMHDGIVLQSDRFKKSLASADQSDYKVVKYGQLVVGFPIDEGVLYIQKATDEGIMSPAYNVWDVDTLKVEADYLELCLHSPQAMQYYCDKLRGSTARRRSIPTAELLALPIRLPTLEEQREQLKMMAKMNALIKDREQQLDLADQLVKSRFIEMFGDPRINPKGYDIVSISSLFDVGSSKRVFESEWRESGVPFYRAREIVKLSKDGYVDNELFIEEEMYEAYKAKYGVPKAGDLMVTGVGTLGVCYIVKETDRFYFKDGNTLWFKNKGLCDVRFIKDQYDTDFVKEQITANANVSTVGTYTITNANNTLVLLPSLAEQEQYVEFCKQVDKSKYHGEFAFKKEVAA